MGTNNKHSMEDVKKHFDSEAAKYDGFILKIIPAYVEMTDALTSAIPFDEKKPIKILDLGCGTGNISKKLKTRYPNSRITCVDMAENMIKMAQNKLSDFSEISYVLSDFRKLVMDEDYDVVISSLALHHLETNEDKKKFYKKIYSALIQGGVFYNADTVLGPTEYLQNLYLDKWKQFMNLNISMEEINNKWIPLHHKEDKPAKMGEHIEWLKEVGFKNVEVVWKYYNHGVYGGIK
ncbi:class I SAM-dependent methyltransferase [Methanobacterium alcaliphilum]|uniref:class I SAM-dependent methyltransferase n=1 Tax=Methanobacterium alcaliphilum TaxID=392018 RepID=UPI002009E45A|nr:class I SAM-dependent methyltransferase [Methanobacterium alcaliphilum]MCK9152461.1 class I SAM-dependent methyltransferase [Methanobacterium alcaliphilum]